MTPTWNCLGPGPEHPAAVQTVEVLVQTHSTDIRIERCRTCGQHYRAWEHETNDWTSSGDRCDTTYIWTALDPDELPLLRADRGYRGRSGRSHRYDTGWR